jgi:hypothetical protein
MRQHHSPISRTPTTKIQTQPDITRDRIQAQAPPKTVNLARSAPDVYPQTPAIPQVIMVNDVVGTGISYYNT